MSDVIFVKDYRSNDELRASFNELVKKTFGLDFEDWYQNGYWTEKYNPYSMVENGKVIANVSVNLTDYLCDLDKIIAAFGKEIKQVRLTFAPKEKEEYKVLPYRAEDCTLFIKGKGLEGFESDMMRFPELAHA